MAAALSPLFRNLAVDDDGFDARAAFTGAQFAYTVPNFSNPTGRMVGLARRQQLVDAAHATGTWLVEDDPYGGLHFDASSLPSLIELSARAEPNEPMPAIVVYLGTVSKEIAPGLRVGWAIAAPEMIEALTMAKLGSDMCTCGVSHGIRSGRAGEWAHRQLATASGRLYRKRRGRTLRGHG